MTTTDIALIEDTRAAVFAAYRAGHLDVMMQHFHPEVIQIPAYDKVLVGKEAVRANYAAALSLFKIDMTDDLENMAVDGNMATTHGLYKVVLTPKAGGEGMERTGRYMVLMRRWADSPTGWSTFRELVQPSTP